MIRKLFFVLVVANIVAWLWWSGSSLGREEAGHTLPPGGERLILLAERQSVSGSGAKTNLDTATVSPLPPETMGDDEASCYLYGPLGKEEASQALDAVRSSGESARLLEREGVTSSEFWVYLPANRVGHNTARVLDELKANNIDSFVFAEGTLKGGVALTVAGSQEQASEQAESFMAIGYEAEIYEMRGYVQEFWLAIDSTQDAESPGQMVLDVLETEITPIIREIPCQTVASRGEFP